MSYHVQLRVSAAHAASDVGCSLLPLHAWGWSEVMAMLSM